MNDLKQLLNELYSTYVAGDLVKAEEIALQALDIDPTSDYAHMILASIYHRLNRLEDSLKQYDLIQDKAILKKETMSNYAAMKLLYKKNAEAMELFAELVKNHPDYAPAWYNYSNCFVAEQKWEDAIQMYNKAEELGFVSESLYTCRGLCNQNINRLGSAQRDFELALKINPNNLATAYNLAEIYRVIGDFKKAVKTFSFIIEKDLKYPSAMGRRLLARVNIKNKKGNIENHKLAQAEADKIVELGLPFMKIQDKNGNPLRIVRFEITKDGRINPFTLPINPKK